MANSDNPFGFTPVKSPAGNTFATEYKSLSGTKIREGDPLVLSNGRVARGNSASAAYIGIAAAADTSDSPSTATQRNVLVYDDPDQVFEVQSDSASVTQSATVGGRFLCTIGSPSTASDLSKAELAVLAATSAAQPFLVLGLSQRADNETGSFSTLRVKIMNHQKADV